VIIICLVLINVLVSSQTLIYPETKSYAISSIRKSNVFFPNRNTVCKKFDTVWETHQRHDNFEIIDGLKNANSKYKTLLDNKIILQAAARCHAICPRRKYDGFCVCYAYTLTFAVYSLRINVKYSKLDIDIKPRLEAQVSTHIEMNEATIESTQQFLSGIAQTVDMILLQTNAMTRDLEIIKEEADKRPAADGIILTWFVHQCVFSFVFLNFPLNPPNDMNGQTTALCPFFLYQKQRTTCSLSVTIHLYTNYFTYARLH